MSALLRPTRTCILALALFAAVALAATIATMSAHADFINNEYCDAQTSTVCWYVDGTPGNLTYAKAWNGSSNGQDFAMTAATNSNGDPVCTNDQGQEVSYVQYNTSTGNYCPFTTHSYDQALKGDEIVRYENVPFVVCLQSQASLSHHIYEAGCTASGEEFVLGSVLTGGYRNVYNVLFDDSSGALTIAGSPGVDGAIGLDYTDGGLNSNQWQCFCGIIMGPAPPSSPSKSG